EQFIAKNRAKASTASQARSKAKQLERLELEEIASDAPTAAIRCPEVTSRQGPAVRCTDLAIGYPDHTVAEDVAVEIDHGLRVAIVGDNGQGKTTFLRTLVGSLEPVAGRLKWGYGCEIGTYAQHVYTTLPEDETVLGYLERVSARGTKTQRILDLAGAMLFRGQATEKKVRVLSGGERARLCLAGLLLGDFNVLVLDEPGNHLDVETIEALATALQDYAGTVIFTSHDRSFVEAVATSVIEVAGGRVVQYPGSYHQYVERMNAEIDAAEAARPAARPSGGPAPKRRQADANSDRRLRKELAAVEKTVARLDGEKRQVNDQLLAVTDANDAVKLHAELTTITQQLAAAEDRWLELQETLAD
ncbi:MAG: ABC transporter ATP-binding protein, partial [Planctomycetia bacterium]|nr:ABC transporter ATP-binding protein [Planctomycetia bacterium]